MKEWSYRWRWAHSRHQVLLPRCSSQEHTFINLSAQNSEEMLRAAEEKQLAILKAMLRRVVCLEVYLIIWSSPSHGGITRPRSVFNGLVGWVCDPRRWRNRKKRGRFWNLSSPGLRLVTDDQSISMRDGVCPGKPAKSSPFIEIRGVGIIDIWGLYSAVLSRDSSQVQIAVYWKNYTKRSSLWSSACNKRVEIPVAWPPPRIRIPWAKWKFFRSFDPGHSLNVQAKEMNMILTKTEEHVCPQSISQKWRFEEWIY